MRVIHTANVHTALPEAIKLLSEIGVERDSRVGRVLVSPEPVATVYQQPTQRLTFWEERDVNTAFLVYEALWMLAGRNDIKPLKRYVNTFDRYSDDGATMPGAYGYRWRRHLGFDQLPRIAEALTKNPDDRRCVLQIWDSRTDLGVNTNDAPCNDTVTFQRGADGALNMVVFCRSNDIVWGAYFANAFHFSVLHEYMARWIGCAIGTYTQISVNWHGYLETFNPLRDLGERTRYNPYASREVEVTLIEMRRGARAFDGVVNDILSLADAEILGEMSGFYVGSADGTLEDPFLRSCYYVLWAHELYRTLPAPERYERPLYLMNGHHGHPDLITSMGRWLYKRMRAWDKKPAQA